MNKSSRPALWLWGYKKPTKPLLKCDQAETILYSDFLGYMTLSKLDFLFLENITGLRAVDIFLASIYAPCLGKLSQYLKSWVIVHLKKNTKISHKSGHF